MRVIVIEPGAVDTELPGHITDTGVKRSDEEMYAATSINAQDIADIIAFAVGRPAAAINEILVRPAGQAG